MKEVKITRKIRNIKSLRKRIYKNMLYVMENYCDIHYLYNEYYPMGFCYAFDEAITYSYHHFSIIYDKTHPIEKFLHELAIYKPRHVQKNDYWWKISRKTTDKRMKILRKIISEM